jgi:hypothetical protein
VVVGAEERGLRGRNASLADLAAVDVEPPVPFANPPPSSSNSMRTSCEPAETGRAARPSTSL